MRKRDSLIIALGLFLTAGNAQAGWRYGSPPDAQAVPQPVRTETPVRESVAMAELPRRGVTQRRVLNEIGEPEVRIPPVGRPPIGRWQYPAFIVYFERDRVIATVPR